MLMTKGDAFHILIKRKNEPKPYYYNNATMSVLPYILKFILLYFLPTFSSHCVVQESHKYKCVKDPQKPPENYVHRQIRQI